MGNVEFSEHMPASPSGLTERERFRQTLLFGRPDRVPLSPGSPRESTLAAWHTQGLPQGVDWHDYLLQTLGIPRPPRPPHAGLGVSFAMIPTFEEKVLEHRDGHYIVQDWMGAITEIADTYDYTYIRSAKDFVTRKWHCFPVQDRADWEKRMRWRYDPHDPRRFPADFAARCRRLRERDYPLQVSVNGPFWQLREWLGFETLCTLLLDEPGWVQEMIDFWAEFVLATLEPVLAEARPDAVQISEDMAYKAHSMISPAMVRRFLLPCYERWVQAIQGAGCPIVNMDSDGYIAGLIPLWIEAGINCCNPIEVAAGNDIVEYRRRFGRQMAYVGGIDKRAMAVGGEVLRAEVLRVASLLEEGGYIPSCDHGVPPDVSWPNFLECAHLLAQLAGWL